MTTAQSSQCMDALALANTIRLGNANLRREIRALPTVAGCERVADILETEDDLALTVGQLVLSIRQVGEDKMARYLKHAGIFSASKRVRALTLRQRKALAYTLRNRWVAE